MLSFKNIWMGSQHCDSEIEPLLKEMRDLMQWREQNGHSLVEEKKVSDRVYQWLLNGEVLAEIRRRGLRWYLTQDDRINRPDFARFGPSR